MADQHPFFIVDESVLPLPATAQIDLERRAEDFLDLLDDCREGDHDVYRVSWIYDCEVFAGLELWTILFQPPPTITLGPDTRRRLQEALDKCIHWDVGTHYSDLPAVPCSGGTSTTTSLSFVVAAQQTGCAIAVVPFLDVGNPRGAVSLTLASGNVAVHHIGTTEDLVPFWRSVPEIENLDAKSYMTLAPSMFPNARFHSDLTKQTNRFSRRWDEIRPEVTRHLIALHDHYRRVYEKHGGENELVKKEMLVAAKIDVSPESPNTHKKKGAMEERDVDFDGVPVRCEWHAKLEWDVDRIHFCYGHPKVDNGKKLIIGIFAKHLTI